MHPSGRIWFDGNPWPGGHAVKHFAWSGRLEPDGRLWFDLHLDTADYDAEADPVSPPHAEAADWHSPIVWCNYHACTLSSTNWADEGSTGLPVGSPDRPWSWASLAAELTADPAAEGAEVDFDRTPAFRIYLTGHDSVADHRVRIRPAGGTPGLFTVDWTGRIALSYAGDDHLKHTFRAVVKDVPFEGFAVAEDLDADEARRLFVAACRDAGAFELHPTARGRSFIPRPHA